MSAEARPRAWRWVIGAATGLVVTGAFAVAITPGVLRSQLVDDRAEACRRLRAFERARPTAEPGGPVDAASCLDEVVDELGQVDRDTLANAWATFSAALPKPHEPFLPIPPAGLLDGEIRAGLVACDGASLTRWRGAPEPALSMLVETRLRETDATEDPDERLRSLGRALAQAVDVYASYDDSLLQVGLWARHIGGTGAGASEQARREVADRLRALAASLPDMGTANAAILCAHASGVEDTPWTSVWSVYRDLSDPLHRAATHDPAVWGEEPPLTRATSAVSESGLFDARAAAGPAYVAAILLSSAHLLAPEPTSFLGERLGPASHVEPPPWLEPCVSLTLPALLESRELVQCTLDRAAARAMHPQISETTEERP